MALELIRAGRDKLVETIAAGRRNKRGTGLETTYELKERPLL